MQLDLFTEKKELNEYERKQLEKALRYGDGFVWLRDGNGRMYSTIL